VNTLGIKGIGEIGIVVMNAAVANAVFNATSIRPAHERQVESPFSLFFQHPSWLAK
jgi:CO/xanthine dehydrogenase Mo-binding subunit